jgi:hypothetical protein
MTAIRNAAGELKAILVRAPLPLARLAKEARLSQTLAWRLTIGTQRVTPARLERLAAALDKHAKRAQQSAAEIRRLARRIDPQD